MKPAIFIWKYVSGYTDNFDHSILGVFLDLEEALDGIREEERGAIQYWRTQISLEAHGPGVRGEWESALWWEHDKDPARQTAETRRDVAKSATKPSQLLSEEQIALLTAFTEEYNLAHP